MENNLINDISKVTTIPKSALNRLNNIAIWCITDAFKVSLLNNNDLTEIDLGIGKLCILNEDEQVKYKFIPNELLEQSIIDTSLNNRSHLELNLEEKIVDKILNTYKTIV